MMSGVWMSVGKSDVVKHAEMCSPQSDLSKVLNTLHGHTGLTSSDMPGSCMVGPSIQHSNAHKAKEGHPGHCLTPDLVQTSTMTISHGNDMSMLQKHNAHETKSNKHSIEKLAVVGKIECDMAPHSNPDFAKEGATGVDDELAPIPIPFDGEMMGFVIMVAITNMILVIQNPTDCSTS